MINRSGVLDDCLQSVVDQTMGAWEAIVADDASRQMDVEQVVERMRYDLDRGVYSHQPEKIPRHRDRDAGHRVRSGSPPADELAIRGAEEGCMSDW
jgi:glycosyltransferase involved in cell wall biosynthesis